MSVDVFLLREIAAKYELDQRTLVRALEGKPIRGAAAQRRAAQAVEEYRRRTKPKETESR